MSKRWFRMRDTYGIEIAPDADLFLVVGSTNSSNSVRMVEVALAAGARAAYLVDNAAGIDPAWLEGVGTVGLCSGASVPEILVGDVLHWLADRGYAEVEEITTANEKLTFSLPRELKRDMAPGAVR